MCLCQWVSYVFTIIEQINSCMHVVNWTSETIIRSSVLRSMSGARQRISTLYFSSYSHSSVTTGGAGGPCPPNGCLCPPQDRRQSSVIAGEKNIWGVQINLTLIFGREDQKTSFYPGHLPAFGTQVSLTGPLAGGVVEFNRTDLAFSSQIQGWRPKKRSSVRNLRLSLCVHLCFLSWIGTKFYSRMEGHKPCFTRAQAPKCIWEAPGLLLSFGARSSFGGHTSRLRGHEQ